MEVHPSPDNFYLFLFFKEEVCLLGRGAFSHGSQHESVEKYLQFTFGGWEVKTVVLGYTSVTVQS